MSQYERCLQDFTSSEPIQDIATYIEQIQHDAKTWATTRGGVLVLWSPSGEEIMQGLLPIVNLRSFELIRDLTPHLRYDSNDTLDIIRRRELNKLFETEHLVISNEAIYMVEPIETDDTNNVNFVGLEVVFPEDSLPLALRIGDIKYKLVNDHITMESQLKAVPASASPYLLRRIGKTLESPGVVY